MAPEFLRPKGITVYTYPQQVGDISNSPTPIMLDSTRETTSTSHVTGLPKTGSSVDYFRTSNGKIVLKSIDIKVTMCFFLAIPKNHSFPLSTCSVLFVTTTVTFMNNGSKVIILFSFVV